MNTYNYFCYKFGKRIIEGDPDEKYKRYSIVEITPSGENPLIVDSINYTEGGEKGIEDWYTYFIPFGSEHKIKEKAITLGFIEIVQ